MRISLKEIVNSIANRMAFRKKFSGDLDYDQELLDKDIENIFKRYTLVSQIVKKPLLDFESLEDLLGTIEKAEELSKTRQTEKGKTRDVDVIANTEEWLVVTPKSVEASCALGRNTKWCISATRSKNSFQSYKDQGAVHVFFINRKTNEKFAATVYSSGGKTILDARDAEDTDLFNTENVGIRLTTFDGSIFQIHNHAVYYKIDSADDVENEVKEFSNYFKKAFTSVPSALVEKASEYLHRKVVVEAHDPEVDGELYKLSDDFKIAYRDKEHGEIGCAPKNEKTMLLMEFTERPGPILELLKTRKMRSVMCVNVGESLTHYRWYFITEKGEFGRITSYHITIYTDDLPSASTQDTTIGTLTDLPQMATLIDIKMYRMLMKWMGLRDSDEEKNLKNLWEKEENGTSLKKLYTHLILGSDNPAEMAKYARDSHTNIDLIYRSSKEKIDDELFYLFRFMYSLNGTAAFFKDNYTKSLTLLYGILQNDSITEKLPNLSSLYWATKEKNPVWKKFN